MQIFILATPPLWAFVSFGSLKTIRSKFENQSRITENHAMKLPFENQAVIEVAKLRDYLLSSAHPVGHFKAAFFYGLRL
jgi:hypothetical protein